jgi:hypothetical protein
MREANQRHRERYPRRHRRREREAYLRKRYGLTVQDYNEMLLAQGGRCAICGTDKPPLASEASSSGLSFSIDHDHQTGAVRGLLCAPCNFGIGNLGDDPARLRAAARYLEEAATRAELPHRVPQRRLENVDGSAKVAELRAGRQASR